jgi:hypothetical protein
MKQATGMSRKFRECHVTTISDFLKSVSWSLLDSGRHIFFPYTSERHSILPDLNAINNYESKTICIVKPVWRRARIPPP